MALRKFILICLLICFAEVFINILTYELNCGLNISRYFRDLESYLLHV